MPTEKTPNYSAEQTAELKAAYVAAPTAETVAAFAAKFGKTAKSIIAKLSREGVYKPKQYLTKANEKPVKKDEQADAIGKVLRLSDGETDSLAKANKTALAKIFAALANSIPVEAETPEQAETKAQAAQTISEIVGLTADEARSLTRAGFAPLAKIAAALVSEFCGE